MFSQNGRISEQKETQTLKYLVQKYDTNEVTTCILFSYALCWSALFFFILASKFFFISQANFLEAIAKLIPCNPTNEDRNRH